MDPGCPRMDSLLLQEDLSMLLFSEWIDYRSMGILDMAMTNRSTRILWLQRLCVIRNRHGDYWMHSHSSIRWLIMRGLETSSVQTDVKRSKEITDETFDGFEMCGLRHVSLSDCGLITDDALLLIGYGCSQLNTINLHACTELTDASLCALSKRCPLLHTIDLSFSNMTDIGLIALGQGCPLLMRINLDRCCSISDFGLSALAEGCPRLLSINMSFCYVITAAGISALGRACPLLVSIDLCSTSNIRDAAKVLGHGFPQLRSIALSDSGCATDNGVAAIGSGCPLLRSIKINHQGYDISAGLAALARGCPLLESIEFRGSDVSDVVMSEIVQACPLLCKINLGASVIDSGVAIIAHGCPLLELIDLCNNYDRYSCPSTCSRMPSARFD